MTHDHDNLVDTMGFPELTKRAGGKVHVALDGFNLALEKGTGVATYGRTLSHVLKEMGTRVDLLYGSTALKGQDDLLKEVMFFDSPLGNGPTWWRALRWIKSMALDRQPTAFEIPMTGRVVTDQFASRLPRFDTLWNVTRLFDRAHGGFEMMRSIQQVRLPVAPDVMHWTYPLPLRIPGVPNIYTLHDLVPLRLPYTTLDRKRSYLDLMKWIARTADHIVTVSEASRRDIIDLLGVSEDRVTNTYQSVHIPERLRQRPQEDVESEVRKIFHIKPQRYLLFFGSIEPKKNLGRAIEAFLSSGVKGQLVIVGARAWRSEAELKLLDSLPQGDRRVVKLEYLPFPMLVSLIRAARGVVFPSLYEGFGLPVLEAMMLGTPVISSNTSSLPEVAGDAALLLDPYRVNDLAQAIRQLMTDDALHARLRDAGRKQALRFSEQAYAQRLQSLYLDVLARGCRS